MYFIKITDYHEAGKAKRPAPQGRLLKKSVLGNQMNKGVYIFNGYDRP